jgi:hypothetical protein
VVVLEKRSDEERSVAGGVEGEHMAIYRATRS